MFVIRNIELYPDNSLEIFNRWGVQVYGVDGYGQNGKFFRGISEGRVTIQHSAELPVGTYWYVLKYKTLKVFKNTVQVIYILTNNKKKEGVYFSSSFLNKIKK